MKALDRGYQLESIHRRHLGINSAGHSSDLNKLSYPDTLANQVWHFDFLCNAKDGERFIIIIKENLCTEYFSSSVSYYTAGVFMSRECNCRY